MAAEVVKTIRASGGDYTSLSAWVAGEQRDLVAANEIAVAECYNDWPTGLGDSVTVSGFTANSDCYPVIRTPTSERHTGKLKDTEGNYTGFTLTSSAWNSQTLALSDYVVIEGVAFVNFSGGLSARCIHTTSSTSKIHCCIVSAPGGGVGISSRGEISFSIAHDCSTGFRCILSDTIVTNCTSIGNSSGFSILDNRTVDLRNCLAANNATADFILGSSSTANHCASSDATADDNGGTGNRINQTFTFADAANGDYHLAESDAGARGFGGAYSTTYNYDIDGDAPASPYDIGADYFVAGGVPDILLNSDATLSINAEAALSTLITMAASASISATASAELSSDGALLTASATVDTAVDAQLTTAISLAGAATIAVDSGANLSTQIVLSCDSSISSAVSADIVTSIDLSAAGAIAFESAADLTTRIDLIAAASVDVGATAELAGAAALLAADAELSVVSAADLQTAIALSASASLAVSADAALAGDAAELAASAAIECTANADLESSIHLAADASVGIQASADLSIQGAELAANASMGVSASAALETSIILSADALMSVIASGDIVIEPPAAELFAGASVGVSAAGDLLTEIHLSAEAGFGLDAFAALYEPIYEPIYQKRIEFSQTLRRSRSFDLAVRKTLHLDKLA